MSKQTSKYGKNSPCDGCEHIAKSTGDLPCRECHMVKKPSNYQPKDEFYAILSVDNEEDPADEVLAFGDFTIKEANMWAQFYTKQSSSPTETIYLLKGFAIQNRGTEESEGKIK